MTDPEYFLRRQERADGEWRFGTGDRWGWMARCWISNAAIIGSAVKSLAQELGPSVNLNNRER